MKLTRTEEGVSAPPPAGPGGAAAHVSAFISYSHHDSSDFAQALRESLENLGISCIIDVDIPPGVDYESWIRASIEMSELFVFVISPASVKSKACLKEIEHAARLNKRLIPVVFRKVPDDEVHEAMRPINWIFIQSPEAAARGAQSIKSHLGVDVDWVRVHTRLLIRAQEWDRRDKHPGHLLTGRDLTGAELWLAQADADAAKDPRPTPLQSSYVEASRRHQRRRRRLSAAALLAALLLVALGVRYALTPDENKVTSGRIAGRARAELAGRPHVSFLLAVEALKRGDTPEARGALRDAAKQLHAFAVLDRHNGAVNSVAFSPDGGHVVTTDDKFAHVWTNTGQLEAVLEHNVGPVLGASFSPDGEYVVTSASNQYQVWRWRAGERHGTHLIQPLGHRNRVRYSPDGGRVVTASDDSLVEVWELRDNMLSPGGRRVFFENVKSGATDASFSHNGRLLVATNMRGTAKVWAREGDGYRSSFELDPKSEVMYTAAFSEIEEWIVTVGEDGHTRVYAPRAGRAPHFELPASDLGLRSAVFGRRDKLLLTAGEDAVARVWDVGQAVAWWDAGRHESKRLESLAVLKGHGKRINGAVFNPAGDTVATASADGTVILWRVTPPTLEESPGGGFSVERAEGLTLLCLRPNDLNGDILRDLRITYEEAEEHYKACKERRKQPAR